MTTPYHRRVFRKFFAARLVGSVMPRLRRLILFRERAKFEDGGDRPEVFPFRGAAPPPWCGNVDLSALFSISVFFAHLIAEF